ncbi:diaminobutyrate--2-oxoglutarate transaminase [Paracoccaceae bacterium GXU_MW_L88]
MTDTKIFETRESEARSYCRGFPTVFKAARGSELIGENGTDYIDFLAGCASLNYGHNDPDMKAALIDYINADGVTHGLDMFTSAKADFLEAFDKIILGPRNMDHRIMFCGPTGTNAVEAALKLARKVKGRTNVVSFTNGFHGVTMGALAATGNQHHRMGPENMTHGVTPVPYDNYADGVESLKLLEKMLDDPSSGLDQPAAIIMETVQGEGGLNAASAEFIKGVAALAKKHDAIFIVDDIQAGCGRTGTFFSFEEMGVVPDMITMAKSLSGMGLPFAAVLIRPEYDDWEPAEHNGTFRGNNHAFVTARVALEKFWADDAFQKDIARRGQMVHDALKAMQDKLPGSTLRGRGMIQGINVVSGELASDICRRCFESGLIIETSGANDEVVKILAPLTTPDELLEKGLGILASAFDAAINDKAHAAE